MKHASVKRILYFSAILFLILVGMSVPAAWSGPIRITMSDGNFVEAPYFWEEEGQIKFEIPGGIAGFPKSDITSIQEILDAREFDPEVLVQSGSGASPAPDAKLQDLIASSIPPKPSYEKLSEEESLRLLQSQEVAGGRTRSPKETVYSPMFSQRGDFNELVRLQGQPGGPMLFMRNILSSRVNLTDYRFVLTLYDGEGNVLQRRPCEVSELQIDPQALRKLGIRERFYAVMATVKPDAKIKRYEMAAVQR